MTTPIPWQLQPLVGADDLRFGMTLDQVVRVLGEPESVHSAWRSSARNAFWHGSTVKLVFDPGLVFIELSRGAGPGARLLGLDPFALPAEELVQQLVAAGHAYDGDDPELGYSYSFPALQLALWRPTLPDDDEDEDGRWFATVGLGAPGYFDD